MPTPPNRLARILVPLGAAILAVGVAASFYVNTKKAATKEKSAETSVAAPASPPTPGAGATSPTVAASTPPQAGPVAGTGAASAEGSATTPQPVAASPQAAAAPAVGGVFKAKVWPVQAAGFGAIGGLDPAGSRLLEATFSPIGAGVASVKLARQYASVERTEHLEIQASHELRYQLADGTVTGAALVPFAAAAVRVNGVAVPLAGTPSAPVWNVVSPGVFEAMVLDGADQPVLRIQRSYVIADNSYTIAVRQSLENRSGMPLQVEWFQFGPVELPKEGPAYGLDARYSRFGYLLSPGRDPSRKEVQATQYRQQLAEVLGKPLPDGSFAEKSLWPNERSSSEQHSLVWLGTTNRYFAVTAFPLLDTAASGQDLSFNWVRTVDRVVLNRGPGSEIFGLRMSSPGLALAPGASAALNFAFFSGPMERKAISAEPLGGLVGLPRVIVYNLGGMCGFCTFDWLTGLLRWVLTTLHDYVARDWGIAIMLLVLCVRTILHPVTKWSQLKMGLMGKKMAAVAPKQKAIQEKYKSDPRKLQEETAKLWREEGVNPFGCVAIVPSFLQMPVWFALYALLFFAVELRHEAGFYGVFQAIFGGPGRTVWFLADLSEPDRLVYFGRELVTLWLIGPISSINILPLALGVVFFIQQKYMTPPMSATMTPEQEMQQKIMKWMTVVLFPLFMYNAPAGLSLYFFTNSTLAILESRYIRSHLDQYEKEMEDRRKARGGGAGGGGSGGGGFMAKLMAMAEAKQREMEAAKSGQRPPRKKV